MVHPSDSNLNGFFDGLFLNNYGKIVFSGGNEYIGMFKHGKMTGYGEMKYFKLGRKFDERAVYKGHWQFNSRCGPGTMLWLSDRTNFTGTWKNDRRIFGEMEFYD